MNADTENQLADGSFEFLSIFLEGLPFIFLGTLISGFLGTYLPRGAFEKILPKNRTLAVIISGFLGAIFPVCECAVVPVIRRLVKNGLPVSCALSYMLAAPIFNPITAYSTFKAFNSSTDVMFTRLGFGYLIAVIIALIAARFAINNILKSSNDQKPLHEHHHPRNLTSALQNSLRDLMDVGLYFAIGVILTAILKTAVVDPNEPFWKDLGANFAGGTIGMMILAFLLSLCSTSDAFIAANSFDHFPIGPKLAFMIFGPMVDAKLIFLYSTVFKWRFILFLTIAAFLLTGIASWIAQNHLISDSPKAPVEDLLTP